MGIPPLPTISRGSVFPAPGGCPKTSALGGGGIRREREAETNFADCSGKTLLGGSAL